MGLSAAIRGRRSLAIEGGQVMGLYDRHVVPALISLA